MTLARFLWTRNLKRNEFLMQILCTKQLTKVQDTVQFYYTVLHDKLNGDSCWDLNPQWLRAWLSGDCDISR